jgi:hypothetical protein
MHLARLNWRHAAGQAGPRCLFALVDHATYFLLSRSADGPPLLFL